jgi:hypothetical protein
MCDKKLFLSFVPIFILIASSFAQQGDIPLQSKAFVIIESVKSYAVAKNTAKALGQQLDLRGLKPNKKSGLTFSDTVCENEGGYPCYIARGRYDDGDYISIEWSNAFTGFAKGYYIVIVGSYANTRHAKAALRKAKKFYRHAYIKKADVYVGCMH